MFCKNSVSLHTLYDLEGTAVWERLAMTVQGLLLKVIKCVKSA